MLFVFTMGLQPATEPERAVARLRGMLPKPTGFLTPEVLRHRRMGEGAFAGSVKAAGRQATAANVR